MTTPTPEDAAWGALDVIADSELPRIAAGWLAEGFDSEPLRDVAAMSAREGHEARRLMPEVLTSIGHPPGDSGSWDAAPWRGRWPSIQWSVVEMDRKFSPYAAAQRVIEIVSDVPDLWHPGRGPALAWLLDEWDTRARDRAEIASDLRRLLRSLRRVDVPPLIDPGDQR